MRKALLLLAAMPLLFAPPALAKDGGENDPCRPPEIAQWYDTEKLAMHVKLPATGCPSREHTMFMVSASITRFDDFGPTSSIERSVMCGPFLAAEDQDSDYPPAEYFCELDVALDHPEVETIHYDIDVAYPGATSERNTTLVMLCRSDGNTAACDE